MTNQKGVNNIECDKVGSEEKRSERKSDRKRIERKGFERKRLTPKKNPSKNQQFDFTKKNKVSIWVSDHPYTDIPDEYFDERFISKTRATNQWSDNFHLNFFCPENMETNGAHSGSVNVERATGECSFSSSYMDVLKSKARKKKVTDITWIVLLFEYEYSVKLAGVEQDEYLTFLGAFDYDDSTDSLYEPES